ncbi:MAG: sulfatase [Mailhella sp.]|nr:sulfatase [Mailhella sp.]
MENPRNAIVCMFDTWQFNYTGCYGNDWIKTPYIDKFAREGVLFENAYGNNMPTLPVRRSMMTGRYTLHEIGWGPLRLEDTTIADLCWGTGVDTGMAYNSKVLFINKGGFARGFAHVSFSRGYDNYHFSKDELYTHYKADDLWSDPGFMDRVNADPDAKRIVKIMKEEVLLHLRHKQYWEGEEDQPVATNIGEAIKMLENMDRSHGFFLWIDSFDPHEPWDPPSVWDPNKKCPYDPDYEGADMWQPLSGLVDNLYTEEQLHHIRMLFAEKITLCDKYFGKLCRRIRELGLWNNTLLWLTSDHGEPMGNGQWGHGIMEKCRPWPYEELVHIPLIIKFPGCPAGKRIKAFAQDCDCAPTVLSFLGLKVPKNMTGKNLIPLCMGEVDKVRDFAIAGFYKFSWSIITEDWSYIHWLNKMDDVSLGESMNGIYTTPEAARIETGVSGGLNDSYNKEPVTEGVKKADDSEMNESMKMLKEHTTLDDEEQWTCGLGSRTDVPEKDELYDRKTDPFQLNNVASQYPEVAAELLAKLTAFMDDLASM